MSYLSCLLNRISESSQEEFPFPDNLEEFLKDFFPNKDVPLDTFQSIFNVSSEDLEHVYKEGYTAYQNQNYEESVTIFRWLVFFNPFVSKFWFSLGAALHMNNDLQAALHSYAVTAMLRDTDPYPHYYAYVCYTLLNQSHEASKALNMALDRAKHQPIYRELKEEILDIQKHSIL